MSIVLDVAIGVVFLYLLLALLVTTTQELLASLLGWRAANLYDAIESMLKGSFKLPGNPPPDNDEARDTGKEAGKSVDLVTALYAHPLIKNLAQAPGKLSLSTRSPSWWQKIGLPSYIPSKTFALALLDILRGADAVPQSATQLLTGAKQSINRIQNDDVRRALSLFVENAATQADQLEAQADRIRDNIEGWFNDRMARASGWYKRKAQLWSVVFGAIVVLLFNADTIHVADRLWKDGALRDSVVAAASAYKESKAETDDVKTRIKALSQQSEAVRAAGFPIGWRVLDTGLCARLDESTMASATPRCWQPHGDDYALLVLGWIVSILAVSLGSNFWFDVLGKALQLRGSGPKVSVSTGEVETRKT